MPGFRSAISFTSSRKLRGDELLARVAAGFAQLLQNVVQRVHADGFAGEAFDLHAVDQLRLARSAPPRSRPATAAICSTTAIRLRVNGGHIERVIAAANAQEAGRLLEGLGAECRAPPSANARAETAVLVAELDDLLRRALVDAGHVAQQRPRSRVEVHAHAVDAAFDHVPPALCADCV